MKRPKTFREIAEMHYGSEPSNEFDKQYRQNRINALEKLLTEQLRLYNVIGSFWSDDAITRLKAEYFEKGLKGK